jgi:hypothetical protein
MMHGSIGAIEPVANNRHLRNDYVTGAIIHQHIAFDLIPIE